MRPSPANKVKTFTMGQKVSNIIGSNIYLFVHQKILNNIYAYLTLIFRLHNTHLLFSTCPQIDIAYWKIGFKREFSRFLMYKNL